MALFRASRQVISFPASVAYALRPYRSSASRRGAAAEAEDGSETVEESRAACWAAPTRSELELEGVASARAAGATAREAERALMLTDAGRRSDFRARVELQWRPARPNRP